MATSPLTPLEILQGRLDAYLAAEKEILKAQAYQVGDGMVARNLRRAELEDVQRGIATVQAEISTLTATTAGVRPVLYLR